MRQSFNIVRGLAGFLSAVAMVLLLPLLIPLAAIAGVLGRGKGVDRTPAEVAQCIENFIEGSGRRWEWDDLISLKINDPRLEALVTEADQSGTPYDEHRLREIVTRVRALESD